MVYGCSVTVVRNSSSKRFCNLFLFSSWKHVLASLSIPLRNHSLGSVFASGWVKRLSFFHSYSKRGFFHMVRNYRLDEKSGNPPRKMEFFCRWDSFRSMFSWKSCPTLTNAQSKLSPKILAKKHLGGGSNNFFTPTWGNDPIWQIFFRWVETTN